MLNVLAFSSKFTGCKKTTPVLATKPRHYPHIYQYLKIVRLDRKINCIEYTSICPYWRTKLHSCMDYNFRTLVLYSGRAFVADGGGI